MIVDIKMFKKVQVKKPTIIEGFPGIGLVGTVACNYLVEKLKMEHIGYVISDKFPPLTTIHNYMPYYPTRIFQSKKHNLIVMFSEFLLPLVVVHPLADAILDWAEKLKAQRIISLAGISIMGKQDEVFGIANDEKEAEFIKKKGVKLVKEGASTGVNAMLLVDGKYKDIPVISLLAESKPGYIDPFAAALVLDSLNKILKLKVNVHPLIDEAERVEQRMREIIERARTSKEHYAQTQKSFGQTYI